MKEWSCGLQRRTIPSPVDGAPCLSWLPDVLMWAWPASIIVFTQWGAGMRRWVHWRQWRNTVQNRCDVMVLVLFSLTHTRSTRHLTSVLIGEVAGSGLDVDSPRGGLCVSSQRAAVCCRRTSSQQRLLCPGDGGLSGDLRPSPGHLDGGWQHDHQPL